MEAVAGKEVRAIDIRLILVVVWLAGGGIIGSIYLISNLGFYKKLVDRRTSYENGRGKLTVYETTAVSMPCLFGVFRPSIYVPMGILEEDNKVHIFTHEETHYKHKDSIWALIRVICTCVYWFHPLVWISAILSLKDSELACDEGTIAVLGDGCRSDYGKTLIKMSENRSLYSYLLCATSLSGGIKDMKQRIGILVKKPRTLLGTAVILVVVLTCLMGCTFGGAKEKSVESEKDIVEENADVATGILPLMFMYEDILYTLGASESLEAWQRETLEKNGHITIELDNEIGVLIYTGDWNIKPNESMEANFIDEDDEVIMYQGRYNGAECFIAIYEDGRVLTFEVYDAKIQ